MTNRHKKSSNSPIPRDTIVRFALLIMSCVILAGCNVHYSKYDDKTINGVRSCSLDVQNEALHAVVSTLGEKLEAQVVLAEGADDQVRVTAQLKSDRWETILKEFASEQGFNVSHDETTNTYTLALE